MNPKKYKFTWSGETPQGNKINGEYQAKNIAYVKVYLRNQNIKNFHIRRKIFSYPKIIPELEITLFYRQMSTMLDAGIALLAIFKMLIATQKNIYFQKILISLKQDIESGKSLSYGLTQFPKYFNPFICHLIRIGEQTGTLSHSLSRAAYYKEKNISFKKQIQQALLYPCVITFVALSVLLIMLIYIVPRFAELFETMHHHLPAFTQFIILISLAIRHYYWILLIPAIFLFYLFFNYKRSTRIQTKIDTLVLKTPLLGGIIKKTLFLQFTRNLAITLKAGVPILDAFKMIAFYQPNILFSKILQQVQIDIASGRQLHRAIQSHSIFPPLLFQMIQVGEETGKLEVMLEKMANLFEEEIDHFITQLKHLLEPLIIAILGVLIGGIVIAMYLPIFKLGTVI